MLFQKKLSLSLSLLIMFLTLPLTMPAQLRVTTFADAGDDVVFNNGFLSYSIFPHYSFNKFRIESGIELILLPNQGNVLSGYSLLADYSFEVFKKPITATAFFLRNIASDQIKSINLGVLLSSSFNHFDLALGNNYRRYKLRLDNPDDNDPANDDFVIVEPWNLMYSFTYTINKAEKRWNIGITVSDYDNYMIEMETNPLIYARGSYSVNENIEPFLLVGYKTAGLLNIKVNYYGYYFRLGLIWKLTK